MKSTSKVIMGAIVVMVVCLALVLCLILVLLAELYCSLLLRRRRQQLIMGSSPSSSSSPTNTSPTANVTPSHHPQSEATSPSTLPPLRSYYSHGVLQAPRNVLFPVVSSCKDNIVAKARNQLSQLHHVIEFEVDTREVGNYVATSPPPTSLRMSPQTFTVDGENGYDQSASCTSCVEDLVYISNPIYDNDANGVVDNNTPPFETPHSSPSCLEICCGSSSSSEEEEEKEMAKASPSTPPLTPMKKLPTEACSVSLRDARSLGTSGSDSVNNDISSSSSASPSTSPSW